jgi:hypothetical protein
MQNAYTARTGQQTLITMRQRLPSLTCARIAEYFRPKSTALRYGI